jgi:hypothetical protein
MTTKVPNGYKLYVPFVRKIDKMAIKIPTSSIARPSKIYPNLDFWFENIPSGNTDTISWVDCHSTPKLIRSQFSLLFPESE